MQLLLKNRGESPVVDERPSKKQRELLSFIDAFIAGHGYGPSYREIMRALNYKSVSTVAIHINNLIAKGHLLKKDNSARSLEVVNSKINAVPAAKVTKTQEKWFIDRVNQHFDEHERAPSGKLYDELCILVGALSVLGFDEAAVAAKTRLSTLKTD
jgi:repressor LexA